MIYFICFILCVIVGMYTAKKQMDKKHIKKSKPKQTKQKTQQTKQKETTGQTFGKEDCLQMGAVPLGLVEAFLPGTQVPRPMW